jgi:hypothetical protein
MVFLGAAIALFFLGIYLSVFLGKNELTPKATQKMREHSITSFWLSFLFLVFFSVFNGVLNALWMLIIFVFLVFNIVNTVTVVEHRIEQEKADLP